MGVPGNANALLLRSAAAAGGYQISRSLRFNSSDSAYLSRTPASAGNRKTWTWSGWVKRSGLNSGTQYSLFGNNGSGNETFGLIAFFDNNIIIGGYTINYLVTSAIYRDPGAWMHIVAAMDTTQATVSNRLKLYVNGSEVTVFSTDNRGSISQNSDQGINQAVSHAIGRQDTGSGSSYFSGYLAEIHFIDGQALTPSSFTEVSATTGQLIPKAYTGSFGTNGFRLPFSDNSGTTSTTLGKDSAGSNNWTPNNFSVAAGAGNDSLVDTPSSAGTDSGLGGQVTGNYATLNPLDTGTVALSNGNLQATYSNTAYSSTRSTVGLSSGKWYWEVTVDSSVVANSIGTAARPIVGIMKAGASLSNYVGADSNGWGYIFDGLKITNGSSSSYGSSFTGGDVIGVALDLDAGTLTFYKNNVSQGQAYSSLSGTFFPATTGGKYSSGNTDVIFHFNAGQRPFAYPVSGFKALCDTNLPTPVVAKSASAFDVKLYTGNSSTQTISGLGFSPDFVWSKGRNATSNHALIDIVRGGNKVLLSDVTDSEYTGSYIQSFDSAGYTINSTSSALNLSGYTYVAWAWDAGTSTSSNGSGSITSQVRANASAGFSIVTFTAPASGVYSFGHGLGVAPRMVIMKDRGSGGTLWCVYHASVTSNDQALALNQTAAISSYPGIWGAGVTSTVVGSTANMGIVPSSPAVAYCFAPVAGYSAMSSFVGNGSSDGVFVYTGFRPRFVMLKSATSATNWFVHDSARSSYNAARELLFPNLSNAEDSSNNYIDLLSNGFKLRFTNTDYNTSGQTYIWAAWAESPFQYARAR